MGLISVTLNSVAQDSTKLLFTTGIGLIKSPGRLSNVLHPSVAFNSGIELTGKKKWFAQFTLDFNTLKYDQQVRDENSDFIFQNTSSSLVMVALSGGKNFYFGHARWFTSPYVGAGYLNIGEPRLIKESEVLVRQEVSRKGGVFAKIGTRLGYKTNTKILKTIYVDVSWWKSPLRVQQEKLTGVSFFIGTRMSM